MGGYCLAMANDPRLSADEPTGSWIKTGRLVMGSISSTEPGAGKTIILIT